MIAVSKDKSLLAFDVVFPMRDEILCADTMSKKFSETLKKQIESCEIVRVKYRPGMSFRILYRIKTENESSLITARTFTNDRATEIYENTENKQAIFYDAQIQTVFWKFPSDRKIKNLNKMFGDSRGKLVAYAPEKCATFCYSNVKNEPFAYAKIFADKAEGERIFSVYKNLPKTFEKLFPNAVCYSPKYQTLLVEAVKGVRLADLENEELKESFQLFGAAVARFHTFEPTEILPEFLRHKPQRIVETLEIIKQILPAYFEQSKNLALRLNQNFKFENDSEVTIHGDVHAKNAIFNSRKNLTLIDLDQTSFGNAASDIGSFIAGLFYKEITGEISANERKSRTKYFLAGYEKIRALPNEQSLLWHTAAAIFTERCRRAINRFRSEGIRNFGEILAVGEQILNGGRL